MSAHTINSYLDILAQTYVNFPVASYSQNLGNELRKSKKFYLYDLGVRNALLKNFASFESRKDKGILAETFVFHELQKKLSPETQIRFWRLKSGEEVDFLWIKNQIPYPIEVKTSWNHQNIPKGLQSFLRRYPDTKEAFVVTNQSKKTIKLSHTNIHFLAFSETRKITEMV